MIACYTQVTYKLSIIVRTRYQTCYVMRRGFYIPLIRSFTVTYITLAHRSGAF